MVTTKAVWVAGGDESYLDEARYSAVSFRRHHPEISRVLITHNSIVHKRSPFTQVIYLTYEKSIPRYRNYLHYYIKTLDIADRIFLFDTDTFIGASLDGVSNLLDWFDFLGCHAPNRMTTGSIYANEIGGEFSEINIGFIAYNTNASVRNLFNNWLDLYETHPQLYGNNDQGPLRDALLEWRGRMYVMPTEYNFRFGFGGGVKGLVKVIHGRLPGRTLAGIMSQINSNQGIRGYTREDF